MPKTTFTFRLKPNGPVSLTVEAETRNEAFGVANRMLVDREVENFYAWNDEKTPGDFTAMYGVWD